MNGISNRMGVHLAAICGAIAEIESPSIDPQPQPLPGVQINFKVEQFVTGPHGMGIISGYNHSQGVYNGHTFPYYVLFLDGYHDVYSDSDLIAA
jgi:hypothetical protein